MLLLISAPVKGCNLPSVCRGTRPLSDNPEMLGRPRPSCLVYGKASHRELHQRCLYNQIRICSVSDPLPGPSALCGILPPSYTILTCMYILTNQTSDPAPYPSDHRAVGFWLSREIAGDISGVCLCSVRGNSIQGHWCPSQSMSRVA